MIYHCFSQWIKKRTLISTLNQCKALHIINTKYCISSRFTLHIIIAKYNLSVDDIHLSVIIYTLKCDDIPLLFAMDKKISLELIKAYFLVRLTGLEPARCNTTRSLVLSVCQFRHNRIKQQCISHLPKYYNTEIRKNQGF